MADRSRIHNLATITLSSPAARDSSERVTEDISLSRRGISPPAAAGPPATNRTPPYRQNNPQGAQCKKVATRVTSERKQRFINKSTDISKALFGVIRECLSGVVAQQPPEVREQINGALARVNACWPHIESLFELAYVECIESDHYVPDIRRKDYVTRLAVAKVLAAASDEADDGTTRTFLRAIAPGVQLFLRSLLSKSEHMAFNRLAYDVFRFTGGDRDRHLEAHFKVDGLILLLCERIFITMLLRFGSYNERRREFLQIMNEPGRPWPQPVEGWVFQRIFSAWFESYRAVLAEPDGAARFIVYYGRETPATIERILNEYQTDLKSAAPAGSGPAPAPAAPPTDDFPTAQLEAVFGVAGAAGRAVSVAYRPPESLAQPIPVTLPQPNYRSVFAKAYEKYPVGGAAAGRRGASAS